MTGQQSTIARVTVFGFFVEVDEKTTGSSLTQSVGKGQQSVMNLSIVGGELHTSLMLMTSALAIGLSEIK